MRPKHPFANLHPQFFMGKIGLICLILMQSQGYMWNIRAKKWSIFWRASYTLCQTTPHIKDALNDISTVCLFLNSGVLQ